MAVQTEQSLVTYSGNGSTVTAYPVPFSFLLLSDVQVRVKLPNVLEPIVLVEGVDFTLTPTTDGGGNFTGGTITTAVAYDADHLVFVFREVPLTQLTEFPELGRFPASAIEKAYDKVVQMCQQLKRGLDRCFRVSDFSSSLTAPYPQKNTVVGIGADDDIRLFDGPALLSLIQLPGSLVDAPTAYWLNDVDRPLKVPDFIGQLGFQLDDSSLWYSTGLVAGNWALMALDEDDFVSNSARRFPTQQSIKAFIHARFPAASVNGRLAAFDGNTGKLLKDSGYSVKDEDNLSSNSDVDLPTQQSVKAYVDARTPAGVVVPYAGSSAPSGYLLCYGQAVSRTTYADLFTAISVTYGTGDGLTTFNLPDLRGRAVAGKDNMGGSAANRLTNSGAGNPGINGLTLGAVGGSDRHQLTKAQMPNYVLASQIITPDSGTPNNRGTGAATSSHVGLNTGGGDEAHPNAQPSIVLNYIIKY